MIEDKDPYSTRNLTRNLCKASFEDFVREFWNCIPGVGKLEWNWHMSFLCAELQDVLERVFRLETLEYDLIINIPFGTSKSSIASVLLEAWAWTRMPDFRSLVGTHTESLALDLADRMKDVVGSDKYQECFPEIQIRSDKSAKEDFANTLGGERKSCTVGGKPPTGRHSHLIVVDDPIDPVAVRSEAELEKAARFMKEVIPGRVVKKGVVPTVLVMQRLHPHDPTHVMLETAKIEGVTPVRHIKLPGEISDPSEVSPPEAAQFYINGLLDPNRLSRRVLQGFRGKLGPTGYSSQILQNPRASGESMFHEEWFYTNRWRAAAPYHCKRVRYWDRGATDSAGCPTAGILMARDFDGNIFLEDCVHGQWAPTERNEKIIATAYRDRARYGPRHAPIIVIEMERGSTGLESFQALAKRLAGFRIREDRPTGSKDTRAEPWADQLQAGVVTLIDDKTWDILGFIDEHVDFRPEGGKRLGKYKDRVDACSGALKSLVGMPKIGPARAILVGGTKKGVRRFIICSREELASLVLGQRAVLILCKDPLPKEVQQCMKDEEDGSTRSGDTTAPVHSAVGTTSVARSEEIVAEATSSETPNNPSPKLEEVMRNSEPRRLEGDDIASGADELDKVLPAPDGFFYVDAPEGEGVMCNGGGLEVPRHSGGCVDGEEGEPCVNSLPAGGMEANIHEVSLGDSPSSLVPTHGLSQCLDAHVLEFADLAPEEVQEKWKEPYLGYNRPPEELVLSKERDGKALWFFLLKQRPMPWEVVVIVDNGGEDRRAISVALGISDAMQMKRNESIYVASNPDVPWSSKDEAPNKHVFDVVKLSRMTVA